MTRMLVAALGAAALLAGCNNNSATDTPAATATATDTAAATLPPPGASPTTAALGLTDAELSQAGLYAVDGTKLGQVASLLRGTDGRVDRLLIDLEGSDRFVEIPALGMAVLHRGDAIDLVATTSAAQLASLPDAKPPAN